MKKMVFVISFIVCMVCTGCGNSGSVGKDGLEVWDAQGEGQSGEVWEAQEGEVQDGTKDENITGIFENVQVFFDAITEEMLNASDAGNDSEAYWRDSLVLLNRFSEEVRLYGISAGEETAMLLYVKGEKVLVSYDFPTFRNFYEESPGLNVCDIDHDGGDEVIISLRTATGQIRTYAMWVCDEEDGWKVYRYEDYLRDVEAFIKYEYDEENRVVTFLDDKGNVLWEAELPEWTESYAYTGTVNFENNMGFDAGTVRMDVIPQIELENSLPYEPVKLVFDIGFADGAFEIKDCDVQMNNVETDAYIKEYVVLEEDSEIEGCEWMQYDRRTPVLRVRIRYKEKPENAYRQKEDYFLFLTGDNEISQVLEVNYEAKGIHIRMNEGTKCEGNHELGEGCDFDAHFEDVTFDGNRDLIISVGNSRHAAYYCAYIYEDDGFRHEKTFEHIPSYEVKQDEKVICGHDTDGMEWDWETVYEYKDGEFLCVEESKTALRP